MTKIEALSRVLPSNNISFKKNKSSDVSNIPADSFTPVNTSFFKSLTVARLNEASSSYNTIQGSINDKDVNLIIHYKTKSLFYRESTTKGTFDGKRVSLETDINGVKGSIGDKQIDVKLYKPFKFKKCEFRGTIGDKEISIKSGSPIEATQNENDILSLICFLEGFELGARDGKLKIV